MKATAGQQHLRPLLKAAPRRSAAACAASSQPQAFPWKGGWFSRLQEQRGLGKEQATITKGCLETQTKPCPSYGQP